MRQQRLSPERRGRIFRYSFEAIVDEVRINVKFPCRIAVGWNYGDGEVRTSSSRPLTNGVARFDQKISFTTNVSFDQDSQKYYEHKSTVQISIITDNGTSLAGFVPIDIGGMINRKDRKELFEIQRCPDKSASIRMRISYRFLSDTKPKNRVKLLGQQSDEGSDFQAQNRSITPRSEYMPKTEYMPKRQAASKVMDAPQYNRNKDLIQKQLLVLKGRVNEYETKFKSERAEKQKLMEALKSKEEIFFTMKTEIKRKQIELEDVYRSLEEYRAEYERIKVLEDSTRKDSDKSIKALQTNERLLHERIIKMEADAASNERKLEKSNLQVERLKKQKDNLLSFQKEKTDEFFKEKQALNESIRVLRREKEDAAKAARLQKEALDRNLRQANKNFKDTGDELEAVKSKLQLTQKKLTKLEQNRTQEFHKFNVRISDMDKVRQQLTLEIEALKLTINKKQISWAEASKSFELRIAEQKSTISNLKTQLNEIVVEKSGLQNTLAVSKQSNKNSEEEIKRLEKDIAVLKGQVSGLTEQLQSRNVEIKTLNIKIKDMQQEMQRQQAHIQQAHEDNVNDLSNRLKEVKKAQETKNATTLKILARKEKQLEESLLREQKLQTQIDNMKEEAKKMEYLLKERMDGSKKLETSLRYDIQELVKKCEKTEEEMNLRLESQSREIHALEQALSDTKDILGRTTERQHKFRLEVQSLTQQMVHAEQNKQLISQLEDRLRQFDKRCDELTEQVRMRELKEIQITKMLNDTKQRLAEADTDRNKKDTLLKEKQKTMSSSSKQLSMEIEEKKKEILRRDVQIKNLHEESREAMKRERQKYDQLSVENERINNELAVARSTLQTYSKTLDQLQIEVKNFRQNQRSLLQEKEELLRSREDGELYRRDLDELRGIMQESLASRDKEIRMLKNQKSDLEREHSELSKMYARNNLLVEQLVDIASKLGSLSLSSSIISTKDLASSIAKSVNLNEYDRLLELRKLLVVAEGRWRKEMDIVIERDHLRAKEKEKDSTEIDQLNSEMAKLKGNLLKLKKQNEELTSNCDHLKDDNQKLQFKLDTVESDYNMAKSNINQLQNKVKELNHDLERSQADSRQLQTRYESLLEEARVSLTEKAERQKKELTANIRKLEMRLEDMEEKNFKLELENQKVVELTKREEENKKVLARMYELERENMHLQQTSTQKVDKVENDYEKLLWQKKSLEDNLKNTISKFERTLQTTQQQLEKANAKGKEIAQQLRDKEVQITKTEEALQRLQFELNTLKISSQDDKEKFTNLDNKQKTELNKIKAELAALRKQSDEQKDQLASMQSLKILKATLEEQLNTKEKVLAQIQEREDKLSEQLFRLTQKLDETKWEYDQKIQAKDNEIISMQQQMYAMNSKENMRMLRQNEASERFRQLQNEKKNLARELYDYKSRWQEVQEKNRLLMMEKRELDEFVRSPRRVGGDINEKYEEVLKTFEKEIIELREENEELRGRNTVPF